MANIHTNILNFTLNPQLYLTLSLLLPLFSNARKQKSQQTLSTTLLFRKLNLLTNTNTNPKQTNTNNVKMSADPAAPPAE